MHVSSCHWKEILNNNIVETIGIFSFVCKCLSLISYSIDAERLVYFIHMVLLFIFQMKSYVINYM